MGAASVNGMLQGWRDKSALQRFAEDLEQRKVNLNEKIAANENRV